MWWMRHNLQLTSFSFWRVVFALWSWGLQWRQIGSFLLTSANCIGLQFSIRLIEFPGLLLRDNGFGKIPKAIDQTHCSRPPDSDQDLFWCDSKKQCGASFLSSHWTGHCCVSCPICFVVYILIQLRIGLLLCRKRKVAIQNDDVFVSSWGTHLWNFFTFPWDTCGN